MDNGIKNMNVAIYIRVSTEEQAEEGYSLDSQVERLRAFCLARQWNIVKEYSDPGFSGRNTKRPQYQKMLQDLKNFDGILVIKMDRIHRNRGNFIDMMDQLRKQEKEFISMSESLDTSTAMGRFVMGIIQDIAQLESEQTGERTFLGMRAKAKNVNVGFMGHRACFGFRIVKEVCTDSQGRAKTRSHLEPVPEDLAIVKRAFELYNEGKSMPQICKILNRKYASIHYWLKNPIYAGYYKWHNIIKKADVEAIISDTLWDLVQKRKCIEANKGRKRYDPLLLKDKEVFEVPKEKLKRVTAVRKAKHSVGV